MLALVFILYFTLRIKKHIFQLLLIYLKVSAMANYFFREISRYDFYVWSRYDNN